MKRIGLFMIATIFVMLLLSIQAFASGQYISYIAVTDGLFSDDPEETLEEYGYTVIWTDLNLGTGDDDLLMGFKTTDDYSKALKDLVIADGDNAVNDAFLKDYSGTSEERRGDDFDDDLNEGAGGAFLKLRGTRDASAGAPITDIYVKEGIEPPDNSGWEVVCYFNSTEAADMNKGAGGAFLYLFVKRDYNATAPIPTPPEQEGTEGKYISYIAVTDGLYSDDPEETLEEYGYTVIWTDLNLGTGDDDLLMGFKTTSDYSKALKDLVIADGDNAVNDAFLKDYSGTSEERRGDDFDDDLNEGAGGAFLKLRGTRDASAGAPITDIYVKEGIEPPDNSGWEVVRYYNSTEAADMNKGAGGAFLYLFVKRDYSVTGSVFAQGSVWLLLAGAVVLIAAGTVTAVIAVKKKKDKATSPEADG